MRSDLERAEKNPLESLKLRGRDSEALYLLGKVYERQGRAGESRRLIARASRLSQRIERWATQPLPRLERLAASTSFRSHADIWTEQRLARRARGQELAAWLELVQSDLDAYHYGDAIRGLQDVLKIFPDSSEARSLLSEIDRQRSMR
jgi:hypothetical protein